MFSGMTRRIAAAVAVGVLLLAGCGPAPRAGSTPVRLDFGYADVDHLEVYSYAYAPRPAGVRKATVTDRRLIATWVDYLTDLPQLRGGVTTARCLGSDADGFRFVLRDGSSYEVTHVFLGPGQGNVLIWPDGTAATTEFGSPAGFGGDPVESSWPRAEIAP